MTNLVTLWKNSKNRLETAGIESPTIDARILLIHACGVTRNDLVTNPYREIATEKVAVLDGFLVRRENREPVAHIVGKKAFWNIELKSDTRALVPRPETEVIVDLVLKFHKDQHGLSILDLGTGTGAILLSLLADRKDWSGIGIDASEVALELATENAIIHGLENRVKLQTGNWFEGLASKFDIIVSNPPYIPSKDISSLDRDVREFDPHMALDGGEDGLDPYRIIFKEIHQYLKPNGFFALEFGINQTEKIKELAQANKNLHEFHIVKDLSNIERVIIGRRKN